MVATGYPHFMGPGGPLPAPPAPCIVLPHAGCPRTAHRGRGGPLGRSHTAGVGKTVKSKAESTRDLVRPAGEESSPKGPGVTGCASGVGGEAFFCEHTVWGALVGRGRGTRL